MEALTSQIEERESRNRAQEAEIQMYHNKIKGLENQLRAVDNKKAIENIKPPKQTQVESELY